MTMDYNTIKRLSPPFVGWRNSLFSTAVGERLEWILGRNGNFGFKCIAVPPIYRGLVLFIGPRNAIIRCQEWLAVGPSRNSRLAFQKGIGIANQPSAGALGVSHSIQTTCRIRVSGMFRM